MQLGLIALLLLSLMGGCYGSTAISVSPGTLTSNGVLTVTNGGDTPLDVTITSFKLLGNGESLIYNNITTGSIVATPSTFTIPPSSQQPVNIVLNGLPPEDALYGVLIEGKKPNMNNESGNRVVLDNSVAVLVKVSTGLGTATPVRQELQITPKIQPVALSLFSPQIGYALNNTGNIRERVNNSNSTITGLFYQSTATNSTPTIYPGDGAFISYKHTLPWYAMGVYQVKTEFNVTSPSEALQKSQTGEVLVFPVWLIFIAILLLLVFGIRRSGVGIEIKKRK